MQHFYSYKGHNDTYIMHGLIQYDPGISYTTQNMKFNPCPDWKREKTLEDIEEHHSMPKLVQRWSI